MNSELSLHAQKRQQQRGITNLGVKTVLTFGTVHRQKGSSFVYSMDKEIINQITYYVRSKFRKTKGRLNHYNLNNRLIKSVDEFIHTISAKNLDKKISNFLHVLEHIANVNVILSLDGTVITIMHAYKKVRVLH